MGSYSLGRAFGGSVHAGVVTVACLGGATKGGREGGGREGKQEGEVEGRRAPYILPTSGHHPPTPPYSLLAVVIYYIVT